LICLTSLKELKSLDFESRDRSGHVLADQGDDDDARSTLVAALDNLPAAIRMPAGRRTSCAWITVPNAIGFVRSCVVSNSISLGKRFRYLKKIFEMYPDGRLMWPAIPLERASAAIESDELASAAGCHRRIRKAGLVERQSVLAWR
jgi:hypothetical protein